MNTSPSIRTYYKGSGEPKQHYERARMYAKMRDDGWTLKEIGSAVGLGVATIAHALKAYALNDGSPNYTKRRTGEYKSPVRLSPDERLEMWKTRLKARILQCAKGDGCWDWDGIAFTPNKKYPDFKYGKMAVQFQRHGYNIKFYYAHRVSYWLFRGPIAPGMTVDHICHNPLCVNPDHMRICTAGENASNHSPDWHNKISQRKGSKDKEFAA